MPLTKVNSRMIDEVQSSVNIVDYGAIANDNSSATRTANRVAIQAALDYVGNLASGGSVFVPTGVFYLSGVTLDTFAGDYKYCLRMNKSNVSLFGETGSRLSFEQDGTLTNEGAMILVGYPNDSGLAGSDEDEFTFTTGQEIHGLEFEQTGDPSTAFRNVLTTGGKAIVVRFADNAQIYNNRLLGRFHEGIMCKSTTRNISIFNNYAKFCLGAAAYNINGGGNKNCRIFNNYAEQSFQCVEDGGIDTLVAHNTAKYCAHGFRLSGAVTKRGGANFEGNLAEFIGENGFIIRPDVLEDISLTNNRVRVCGYGAIRIYPGGTAGTWGDVYNQIKLIGNRAQDTNLTGLTSFNGSVISVYGDNVQAIGNINAPATQDFYYINITSGTNLDKVYPLDTITSSAGGTALVVATLSISGSAGSEIGKMLLKEVSGTFGSGNTISVSSRSASGTLSAAADNTNIPPVGLQVISSGSDVSDSPKAYGNVFDSVTNRLKVGASTYSVDTDSYSGTELRDLGKLFGETGALQIGSSIVELTTGGEAEHVSPRIESRYYSVTTSAKFITAPTSARGGWTIVMGESSTDRFIDTVVFGANGSTPTVIQSYTANGSPATRTYAVDASHRLTLQMGSGTYDVETFNIYGQDYGS